MKYPKNNSICFELPFSVSTVPGAFSWGGEYSWMMVCVGAVVGAAEGLGGTSEMVRGDWASGVTPVGSGV